MSRLKKQKYSKQVREAMSKYRPANFGKYKVVIRKGEDGWFVVNCPQLRGCWSQGKTIEEAKKNIKDAIRLYLEVLNEITQKSKETIICEIAL